MGYRGGKNGAGVYQTIINRMPPHQVYIEAFLGGGAVMRLKRPAAVNIGVDLDRAALREFRPASLLLARADPLAGSGGGRSPQFQLVRADALDFLARYRFEGSELVYCDPPYLHSTRGRPDTYAFEMTDAQHAALLDLIRGLRCKVLISGYWSRLYASKLASWQAIKFQTVNRAGRRVIEFLWCNYPEPLALHDYRFLGSNYRERERIKRKKLRWAAALARMPLLERRALLAAIAAIGGDGEGAG